MKEDLDEVLLKACKEGNTEVVKELYKEEQM